MLVDNETFLKKLTSLFESSKEHGSIWLTHKRFTHDSEDTLTQSGQGDDDTRQYVCLLRMTDGAETKYSTKVESSHLGKFYAAYGSLVKASMTTLRKRDKKREKLRSELAARRKLRMTEPIVIAGPKRGSGRKKRQRLFKAARKQQASQQKFKEREQAKASVVI